MLLCVDPDTASRRETAETLREAGFATVEADSAADARETLDASASLDCLITEQTLPDGTGLELVQEVRERMPDVACILFTESSLDDIDTAAFGDVIAEYLPKDDPDAREELLELVTHNAAFSDQTAYPLPDHEDARLAALEQYATNPEALSESFDRLTEFATELFDLNAAAVGLVDAHEQRFLSCHGIALGPIDREDTVCTYAMLNEGVTVIDDVQSDPRFESNQGLVDAGIRFYASAPLVTPNGRTIGTFCVYDDEPRTFSDRNRELLQLLAEEAMDHMALHRRLNGGEVDE